MFFSLKFKSSVFVKGKRTGPACSFHTHTFSFAGFSTLVKSHEGSRGWFVKTRCRGASIPTAADAEVALLHGPCICLQDIRGSFGPSVGTSGSNLSHRHHAVLLQRLREMQALPLHAGMWLTSTPYLKGERVLVLLILTQRDYTVTACLLLSSSLFFPSSLYSEPLISLASSNPGFTWALIRVGDAEQERTSITSTQGLKTVGSKLDQGRVERKM